MELSFIEVIGASALGQLVALAIYFVCKSIGRLGDELAELRQAQLEKRWSGKCKKG